MKDFKTALKNVRKLKATVRELRKTAYHHYGSNPSSYIKFFYYSLIRVNTFIVYENNLCRKLIPHNLDKEFKVIKPNTEILMKMRKGKNLTREFYYDQIHEARVCYIAMCEDELAYIHWVFFKGDHSRFLNISDGTAELNYNTTLPKFRGKRLSAKMMAYISEDLKNLGYKRLMGIIHEFNYPSIKCIKLAGFNEIDRLKALGPFHRKISA